MKIKDILKKVLNYNWKDKEKDNLQKKAIRIMVYFLGIMILFTFLSRFANKLTTPIVSTASTSRDTISSSVKFDGVIKENKEKSISIGENIKIASVNVSEGDNVKKDDVVVEVDINSLNENIKELKKTIYSKERAVTRAKEDYDVALKKEDETIASALDDLNVAKEALDNALDDVESMTMLENDYKEKKSSYEEAKRNKETNLLTCKRAIEDAEEESDTKALKESLDKLNKLLEAEGKVKAKEDSKVAKVLAIAGETTTTAPIISFVDNSAGYKVKGFISKDYEKYVSVGKKVSASLVNGKEIENLKVNSISPSEEDNNMLEVTVNLPKDVGEIGGTVNCNIIRSEKKYDTCIPLESLREEGNSKFVLVTSEEDTILGKELKAKKVSVEVKAKNDSLAAVEGLYIIQGEELIVSSNKNIKDGDKVRLENR